MTAVTGADLPTEILLLILNELEWTVTDQDDLNFRRSSKHGLAALSLVCKHWLKSIWPALFRLLTLHSADDLHFLWNIVDSAILANSRLLQEIAVVHVHLDAAETKPWLVHLHKLSSRLQGTIFECRIASHPDSFTSSPIVHAPFRSLPVLPPSYVRLYRLTLAGLLFNNLHEVTQLIRSFTALTFCHCERLAFVDPSPVVQPRRTRRQTTSTLLECHIVQCQGTSLFALATLGCDIIGSAPHLSVAPSAWSTVLEAVSAVVPQTFDRLCVRRLSVDIILSTLFISFLGPLTADKGDGPVEGAMDVEIDIVRPPPGAGGIPGPSHVSQLTLQCDFADARMVETLPWDALRPVAALPLFGAIRFQARWRNEDDPRYVAMRHVLCAVLRREWFAWALASGKVEFWYSGVEEELAVGATDVLGVQMEHGAGGARIVLDVEEQAEWLLRRVDDTRFAYLQRLRFARKTAEGATHESQADGG
ncbi:hypothetical protein PsYK624_162570 [Phanerochaete sordida]|uniref:F-box domain-containing protein n=1 Tax=Phanerochaete sordida TaxID=48140 RepID=A0A9P3GQM4_9APHY|nr:hypothetical protein PsYK624_162570 [Phanerochaete sordida]